MPPGSSPTSEVASDLPIPDGRKDLPSPRADASSDDALASLEQKYAALQKRMHEERFCWILVMIILLDSLLWNNVQSIGVPLAIFALELLLLTVLATKLGLEEVQLLINATLNGLISRKDG